MAMIKLAALSSLCVSLTLAACTVSTSSSSTKPPAAEPEAAGTTPEGGEEAGGGAGEGGDGGDEAGGDGGDGGGDAGGDGGDGGSTGRAIGAIKNPAATKCKDGEHSVGDRWKKDCNDCWCKDDGEVVCTRKACKGAE